jgi:hypothetical protein
MATSVPKLRHQLHSLQQIHHQKTNQMSQPPHNHGQVHSEDDFANEGDDMNGGDPNWTVPEQPGATSGPIVDQQQTYEPQNSPLASAEEASKIAGAALHICDTNAMDLNGKLYLKLEAWTGIARMAGTVPGIETVKDNVLGGVTGVTARSSLKNSAGKLLSEAEGFVGNDESFWASKPVSDRVNMAQTRAVGRVCRLVFSFIVQIMNKEFGRKFEVTPAEEMLASINAQRSQPQVPYASPGSTNQGQPQAPQMGERHIMPQQPAVPQNWPQPNTPFATPQPQYPPQPPQTWQPPQQPPQTVVYPDSHAFAPQPNVQPPVGQGPTELWQGQIRNVDIKWINTKRGQSQLFLVYLTDGRSATTFDKTIAGNVQMALGRNVEMLVQARGNGRYNINQVRPI